MKTLTGIITLILALLLGASAQAKPTAMCHVCDYLGTCYQGNCLLGGDPGGCGPKTCSKGGAGGSREIKTVIPEGFVPSTPAVEAPGKPGYKTKNKTK